MFSGRIVEIFGKYVNGDGGGKRRGQWRGARVPSSQWQVSRHEPRVAE